MTSPDAFTSFSRGDEVAAEQLRRAFVTIRDRSRDPELARAARQVLDGRRSVRDAVQDPEFQRAMVGGISRAQTAWDELGEEERRALLAEGERERQETARWLGLGPRVAVDVTEGADPAVDEFLTRRPPPTEP